MDEVKKSPFMQYVEDQAAQRGVDLGPKMSDTEFKASKVYKLCEPIHEHCLRELTQALLKFRRAYHAGVNDASAVAFYDTLIERHQYSPKANMVAYWHGTARGMPTLKQKKMVYARLEAVGKGCKLNTH